MRQRLFYRRRLCYNTTSNKVVKAPKKAFPTRKKQGNVPKCGDTGRSLQGVIFLC